MRKDLPRASLMALSILSLFSATMMVITTAQAVHDIAVLSVTPSPTSVKAGELVDIKVVVENQGTESETFNITTYYKTTAIETRTVENLGAGANISLTFTWNTAHVREEIYATDKKEKTYIISATSSIIPGETDTEDNTVASPTEVRVVSQYITVVPSTIIDSTLTPGTNLTVSIYTDYNGSDITGYQFTLSYNPHILHGTNVTNGDLITNATHPDKARFLTGTFDNAAGKLSLTGALFFYIFEPAPLTSGPGTLANVTFTVVGAGDCYITLGDETKLIGYTEDGYGESYEIVSDYKPYIEHLIHGYFRNIEEAIHDVAVVSVTPYPSSVKSGELVNITVVVENQGTVIETFNVVIYYALSGVQYAYLPIETKTNITLEAGASKSLTFVWNTTRKSGTYIIRAVASSLSGEEDKEDNTLDSHDMVTIVAPQKAPGFLPTELIIGIAVVLVGIGTVVVYTLIRRRKPTLASAQTKFQG